MTAPVVPRPAATISIVRDAPPAGFEVLMMQRNLSAGFMPGAYVFPGGAIDREDSDPRLYDLCAGLDDQSASRKLGLERDGLAFLVGAIRECFEEAGLLLCYDAAGELVRLEQPQTQARYVDLRAQLNAGSLGFLAFCEQQQLRLAVDRLTYFSHWITPAGAPKRFDTRFFVATMPAHQEPLHDAQELIDMVWVRPGAALEQEKAGKLSLRTPTIATLQQFEACSDCASLIETLGSQRRIEAVLPAIGADGARLLPGDPGYAEAVANPSPKWQ
jgi:8-oxo-dGTP pyrophosphatase MutT (NUDIX family)